MAKKTKLTPKQMTSYIKQLEQALTKANSELNQSNSNLNKSTTNLNKATDELTETKDNLKQTKGELEQKAIMVDQLADVITECTDNRIGIDYDTVTNAVLGPVKRKSITDVKHYLWLEHKQSLHDYGITSMYQLNKEISSGRVRELLAKNKQSFMSYNNRSCHINEGREMDMLAWVMAKTENGLV